MQNLTSSSSIPNNKKFLVKRIDAEDIEITNEERMVILKALNASVRFVQVGEYTLMLNGIRSIEPVKSRRPNFPIDFIGDVDLRTLPESDRIAENRSELIAKMREKIRGEKDA